MPLLYPNIIIYYVFIAIFIVFLAAGVLQIISMKSKVLSFLFSLFPIGVALMFILIWYTDILGMRSAFFGLVFIGEHFGGFYPIIINIPDLGLGVYITLSGGVLGFISTFMEH